MDKTQKMLQTVINGQSLMKSELLGEFERSIRKLIKFAKIWSGGEKINVENR